MVPHMLRPTTHRNMRVKMFSQHSWDGPIVPKDMQRFEDAKMAVEAGVEVIVVSNHGGETTGWCYWELGGAA